MTENNKIIIKISVIAFLIVFALAFVLVACQIGPEEEPVIERPSPSTEQQETTTTVFQEGAEELSEVIAATQAYCLVYNDENASQDRLEAVEARLDKASHWYRHVFNDSEDNSRLAEPTDLETVQANCSNISEKQ